VTLGLDTYCLDSLRTGRLVGGTTLVAQNAYHRLTTLLGTLRGGDDEANYGLDLASKVGRAASDKEAASLPTQINAELRKDQRIASVEATVTITREGPLASYRIAIACTTHDFGPFELVLGVAGVTPTLLGLRVDNETIIAEAA
jgi:hypothetical protein